MKKKVVSLFLSFVVVFTLVTPAAHAIEAEQKKSLEKIVTTAADAGLHTLNSLADKLVGEAMSKNLGSSEALRELVTPMIKGYLTDAAQQYLPKSIRNEVDSDAWVGAFIEQNFVRGIADEIFKSDLFAKTVNYATADILAVIDLRSIRDSVIKACTDAIWNKGNPSTRYYANGAWRSSAINLNVVSYIAASGINQVNSNYQSINLTSVFRNAATRALNETIAQKKVRLEGLIKEKAAELEAIVKKLIAETKLLAKTELIKAYNDIFKSYKNYSPLTIGDTLDEAKAKAEYNAYLVALKDKDAILSRLNAISNNKYISQYPEFKQIIQFAADTLNKVKIPQLLNVTDSAIGVAGEVSKSTAGGVTVFNVSYDVTNKSGTLKLLPQFEISDVKYQNLLKITNGAGLIDFNPAGVNLFKVSGNSVVTFARGNIAAGGSVKAEFVISYNDLVIGKYIATLYVKKENPKKEDPKKEDPKKEDPKKENPQPDYKITVTGVDNGNKQANIYFNIKSANGKGYTVYLSESGKEGSFKAYPDVNYNAKGAHVKNLNNGVTYYAYIVYEGTSKSAVAELRPGK